mgnify:CR=1 FL=1
MNYPYPPLLLQLQFLCTPAEYQRLTIGWERGPVALWKKKSDDPYWDILPRYRLAVCPICNQPHMQQADTYSLGGWTSSADLGENLFIRDTHQAVSAPCKHFLGIHNFINLHGHSPVELDYFSNQSGEVPYVTPWFFYEDIKTYVVLNGLPICRVESDQFVPHFTVFTLTYFNENRAIFRERRKQENLELGKGEEDFYPGTVALPWTARPSDYDLAEWARQGKLGWLDVADSHLRLQIGQGKEFPQMYNNIQGMKHSYIYREGELQK